MDDSHAAASEFLNDLIARERLKPRGNFDVVVINEIAPASRRRVGELRRFPPCIRSRACRQHEGHGNRRIRIEFTRILQETSRHNGLSLASA